MCSYILCITVNALHSNQCCRAGAGAGPGARAQSRSETGTDRKTPVFFFNLLKLLIVFNCFWAPNPKYGIKMNLCMK